MSFKTLHSLWQRSVMREERIEHLFHDPSLRRHRTIEDWVDALTHSSWQTDGRAQTHSFVISIKFFKDSAPRRREYLQFTVRMADTTGKCQDATFETYRYYDMDMANYASDTQSFSVRDDVASDDNVRLLSPTSLDRSTISATPGVHSPAHDIVRTSFPRKGHVWCEDFEFGQLRLGTFAILLKTVSMYSGYHLLSNQCYWYAYAVYLLAVYYSKETSDAPERLVEEAKRLAMEDSLVFPENVGRYKFIPIPEGKSSGVVWDIFEEAVQVYTSTDYHLNLLRLSAELQALREKKNEAEPLREKNMDLKLQALSVELEALIDRLRKLDEV